MKKFRRWLIHKLGGLCEDDIVQSICEQCEQKEIQRIKAQFTNAWVYPMDKVKEILFSEICRELSKYSFEIKTQELNKSYVYSMELEFILQPRIGE